MFRQARLKLTAWYLLIVFVICLFFTIPTYNFLTHEVERFSRVQRFRIESGIMFDRQSPPIMEDLIFETKQRIAIQLGILNLLIISISGGLSYFLAGKTLRPIKDMMDEQYRFISDSSHELRTPITSLKTGIEVALKDNNLQIEELQGVLRDNLNDVDRLSSLSENLLRLAQFDQKKPSISIKEVDLQFITNHAVESLKNIFLNKNIRVLNTVKNQKVKTSEKELQEILVILLENACKYSPKNSKVKVLSKSTNKSIMISIEDQGIGIKPKDLPFVFDRFYRADDARSSQNAHGYGLGLSIAKKLATNINADISVTSTYKKGSTFIIKIPKTFS